MQVLEQNGYRWSPCEAGSDEDAESDDGEWVEEGEWVQDEAEDFTAVRGDLSDHRPLVVNADDFLRCAAVPEAKTANFRDFLGVISHRDGAHLQRVPAQPGDLQVFAAPKPGTSDRMAVLAYEASHIQLAAYGLSKDALVTCLYAWTPRKV